MPLAPNLILLAAGSAVADVIVLAANTSTESAVFQSENAWRTASGRMSNNIQDVVMRFTSPTKDTRLRSSF